MNLLRVVARPLLAAPFIADGVDALMHPRFHVERAAGVRPLIDKATDAVGLEPLTDQQLAVATRVTGAVTVVAGLRFALGRKPRVAALTLAAIGAPMALVNAPLPGTTRGLSKEQIKRRHYRTLNKAGLAAGVLLASALTLAAIGAPMALVNAPLPGTTRGLSKEQIKRRRYRTLNKAGLAAGVLLASTDRVGQPSALVARSMRRDQRRAIAAAEAAVVERLSGSAS